MLVICQYTQLTEQTPCETLSFLCLYFIFYHNVPFFLELTDDACGFCRWHVPVTVSSSETTANKQHKTCQRVDNEVCRAQSGKPWSEQAHTSPVAKTKACSENEKQTHQVRGQTSANTSFLQKVGCFPVTLRNHKCCDLAWSTTSTQSFL